MSRNEGRPLIAAAQYAPSFAKVDANRERAREAIMAAVALNCSIVVLPECCITGLVFEDKAQLRSVAEPLDGPSTREWKALAREHDIHIVAGLAEWDGAELYNCAVLVDPSGGIVRYRKCHLFGRERELFALGDRLVCGTTPWGKVGLAICYDFWFPEVVRSLAASGVTLVAAPTNWFRPPRQAAEELPTMLPLGLHHLMSSACSNEVVIACADRIGEENGVQFLGHSCIVGPTGRALAGPASHDCEELLVAPWLDVELVRRIGQSHFATRRDALYGRSMVEDFPAGGSTSPAEHVRSGT